MEQLRSAWKELCDISLAFAGQCTFERMVKIINKYRLGWEENSKACRKTSRRRTGSMPGKEGSGDKAPAKRRCTDTSSAARKQAPACNALDSDPSMLSSAMMGMGGSGIVGGMRNPLFMSALNPLQGHFLGAAGMPAATDLQSQLSQQQSAAVAAAMQQVLAGLSGTAGGGIPPALSPFALSYPPGVAHPIVGALPEQQQQQQAIPPPHQSTEGSRIAGVQAAGSGGAASVSAAALQQPHASASDSSVAPGSAIYALLQKTLLQGHPGAAAAVSLGPAAAATSSATSAPNLSSLQSVGLAGAPYGLSVPIPTYAPALVPLNSSSSMFFGTSAAAAASTHPVVSVSSGGCAASGGPSRSRRASLISLDSASPVGSTLIAGLPGTGTGSRKSSLLGDSSGIGLFNAMHGTATSGALAAGKGTQSSAQLPTPETDAFGAGPAREREAPATAGSSLAASSAGAAAAGSSSVFPGQRSRRNSLLGPSGDIENLSLPLPNTWPARANAETGAVSNLLAVALGEIKKDGVGAADTVQNEGDAVESGSAAAGGGTSLARQRGQRRSSIVGPPLSPGEIEQVVGSFEVDEKVTAGATVTT